jgi:glycosyltransferase involved in cell wall biosynthesis
LTVWRLITGEYPPQTGGVSDYSRLVANGLAAAGDSVHVYAPPISASEYQHHGVEIHRLPGHFDPRSLGRLGRELHNISGGTAGEVVLVQYVPHAFGLKAMNLPFCLWLYALSRTKRRIVVMFHEATLPWRRGQSLKLQVLASVTASMAMLVARAASLIFVAIPAWKNRLVRFAGRTRMEWLPVPSNVPVAEDADAVTAMRRELNAKTIIGHFGTSDNAISHSLRMVIPQLLETTPAVGVLLIGRDSMALKETVADGRPRLASRIHATGGLPEKGVSVALSSCDLMLQPYPDGVSARRGSVMAALAHQRAIVTTAGILTEPLWSESGAVALTPVGDHTAMSAELKRLIGDESERTRIGSAGSRLYDERFALRHTIRVLCENASA